MKTRRPMAELLFARLSPELRLFAIRKLGRFAAETSLASMHEEVKTLASAAARGDAAVAVEHVLLPLTRQLESELPSLQAAKSGHLSKVCGACRPTPLVASVPCAPLMHVPPLCSASTTMGLLDACASSHDRSTGTCMCPCSSMSWPALLLYTWS